MSTGIYIVRKHNGKNIAREIDPPPPGKGWLVVPIDCELHDKIARLDPDGYWETELSEALGRAADEFFRTRPVHISAPKAKVERAGLGLFDPRDPEKQRIN